MLLKFISDVDKERVDVWLSKQSREISRSFIKKISQEGGLKINGQLVKCSEKLYTGDEVIIDIPQLRTLDVLAQDIEIEVIYEDEDIIVINKPKGMVVHPAAGNYEGTLVNALLARYKDKLSNINGVIRPGIVHRIDKDTTGVLVIARNNFTHEKLSQLFKAHDIKREYIALVHGVIKNDSGRIEAPIGRHPVERKKMAVNINNGRFAVTHFKVLKRYKSATLIEVTLETGRTHQIRVHMAYIGYPLVGDLVYGHKKDVYSSNGQFLHAKTLGFMHPTKGEFIEFSTNLPEYFEKTLKEMEQL